MNQKLNKAILRILYRIKVKDELPTDVGGSETVEDGGKGSGNFGHSGRVGQVGGSSSEGSGCSQENSYEHLTKLPESSTIRYRGANFSPKGFRDFLGSNPKLDAEGQARHENKTANVQKRMADIREGRLPKGYFTDSHFMEAVKKAMRLGNYEVWQRSGECRAVIKLPYNVGVTHEFGANGMVVAKKTNFVMVVGSRAKGTFHCFPISDTNGGERLAKTGWWKC